MKNQVYSSTIILLAISIMAVSCGPSKKLTSSQANVDRLQKENNVANTKLDAYKVEVKSLNDKNATLQSENDLVYGDLRDLTNTSNLTIADQAKRLKSIQTTLQAQKDIMNKLKTSIAGALMNYKTDELSVSIKDGNVYVSLSEKLLFKSGSDVVDPKGKEALKTLVKVLNTTKDISVIIEGHTDDVAIKTKMFEDNWDLSTARATSIVRIITMDNGFDPNRITASGRGKFHPVTTNTTDIGRSNNRRTEIIISPDLKGLYALID